MKTILLTKGKIALVSDRDFPALKKWKWHAFYNSDSEVWYARRNIRLPNGKQRGVLMHQVLLPGHKQIDHRDGNGLNNQRGNIRPCSRSENNGNRGPSSNNTSGHKGVFLFKGKWMAQIGMGGKLIYLGLFKSRKSAAIAYNVAAQKHFGEFAKLNKI